MDTYICICSYEICVCMHQCIIGDVINRCHCRFSDFRTSSSFVGINQPSTINAYSVYMCMYVCMCMSDIATYVILFLFPDFWTVCSSRLTHTLYQPGCRASRNSVPTCVLTSYVYTHSRHDDSDSSVFFNLWNQTHPAAMLKSRSVVTKVRYIVAVGRPCST